MAISIPYSRYKAFKPEIGKRWGQSFYDYMRLDKITSPRYKPWCDKLYNADETVAKAMVERALDYNN